MLPIVGRPWGEYKYVLSTNWVLYCYYAYCKKANHFNKDLSSQIVLV